MKEKRILAVLFAGVVALSLGVCADAGAAPTDSKIGVAGMFDAGDTTLPPGDYRVINTAKGIEYLLNVDPKGKMTVQDVRSMQLGERPLSDILGGSSSTPAQSGTVNGTTSTQQPATTKSKVETLIRQQVQKQIKKQGPKIETQVRRVIQKL